MTIKKKQLKNNKQINDNQLKNNENTINKNQCTMVPWYHNGKKQWKSIQITQKTKKLMNISENQCKANENQRKQRKTQ